MESAVWPASREHSPTLTEAKVACLELDLLVQRAIEIGEAGSSVGADPVAAAVCLRALRSLAGRSREPKVQNDVAVGLGRIISDDDRLLDSDFGQAIDAVLSCIWPDT